LRKLIVGLILISALLAACGGGGGSDVTSGSTGSTGSTGTTGTGGTGTTSTDTACVSTGASGSVSSTSTAYNVVNAVVDQGPTCLTNSGNAAVDLLYVNVTICAPGSTTTCQTINHVQVDTGSQGLRILSSALNSTMLAALQPITNNGGTLAECTQFVDGYSWGPMVTADLHIGGADTATTGETAANMPMQVIGTTSYAVPDACSSGAANSTEEDTVEEFGANGIIGIGLFDYDCGSGCAQTGSNPYYFSCTVSGGCVATTVPTSSQSTNPIFLFSAVNGVTDNNGAIIELPLIVASGAATTPGSVVFGIGTQSNNALASTATILTTDDYYGYVTTSFIGQNDTTSYFDSGSNAIYFDDSSLTQCASNSIAPGFYCPASTASLTATVTGVNGNFANVAFSIGNAQDLFENNPTFAAFNNIGGTASSTSGSGTFAWGLPVFFGTNMYFAMENETAGGTMGPYFAF
jgi:hypothetical protein